MQKLTRDRLQASPVFVFVVGAPSPVQGLRKPAGILYANVGHIFFPHSVVSSFVRPLPSRQLVRGKKLRCHKPPRGERKQDFNESWGSFFDNFPGEKVFLLFHSVDGE